MVVLAAGAGTVKETFKATWNTSEYVKHAEYAFVWVRGEQKGPRTTCLNEAPKMRKGYKNVQFHFGCLRGTALSSSWVQFPYAGL
jgi:hypothetical protein